MQLSVDFERGEAVPIYRQIAENLKKQIVSDNFPTGGTPTGCRLFFLPEANKAINPCFE